MSRSNYPWSQWMNSQWRWLVVAVLVVVLALFIRSYRLMSFPPSPYWEEVALGYDAYSILKTGRDHHGHLLPIVAFESFGDYKPSLYIYAIVPFMAVFGLEDWVVRMPSVVAGVGIVVGVGYLAWLLSRRQWQLTLIALAVAAISPWAIQFSRAGWEVNLATCLLVWAVATGWRFIETGKRLWLPVILLVLAMYTYHAARIVAPALGLALGGWWLWQELQGQSGSWLQRVQAWCQHQYRQPAWQVAVALMMGLILVLPLALAVGKQTTGQRFAETSIFSDLSVIEASNQRKELAGNTLAARLLYHRYVLFGQEVARNYLSHFSLQFLFLTGDSNARHSIQYLGQLYYVDAFFLAVGAFVLIMRMAQPKSGPIIFLWYWLAIGILPAAITKSSPHALRILPVMPVFLLIISVGIDACLVYVSRRLAVLAAYLHDQHWWPIHWPQSTYQRLARTALVGLIVMVYAGQGLLFWRSYSVIYPHDYATDWQYGYQQMVVTMSRPDIQTPVRYITREQGRPAMYYWFYTKTDPRLVQAANATAPQDQGEFLAFDTIRFINTVNEITDPGLVASSMAGYEQMSQTRTVKKISEITNPAQEVVWVIYEVQ